MVSILRPKALRPGDVVAVTALSGGLEAEEFDQYEHGLRAIEQLGFSVRVSPLIELDRHWWWSAATPQQIAEEFNTALRDPEVRGIFALTGGRTAFSYLDLIDLDAIEADPKPVMGFSDVSTVLLALHGRTGLVCVHGDLVTHGLGDWHDCAEGRRTQLVDLYRRLLTDAAPVGDLPAGGQWECWRSGRASGRLAGGMLNRIVRVQATGFALAPERFDGAILFWEELGVSTAAIWNDLHTLRHAGVLDRISGMVVGTPVAVDLTEGGPDSLREAVLDVLGDRDIPVLGNADVGHNPPNVPLPLGVRAEMDADALRLSLVESAVSV